MRLGLAKIAFSLTLIQPVLANIIANQKCSMVEEAIPAPSQLSTLQKQQIKKSLALPGRWPSPTTSFDEACKANTWQEFANKVGTQDFSFKYLRDQAGNEYAYFNYGLGDNDFGSVHPRDSADAVIAIDDGEWRGVSNTAASLVSCLEQAVNPDVAANQRCSKVKKVIPAPSQLSTLQKQQIKKSLALPGRWPSPTTSFDEACKANTWQEFANKVGTQDFSMEYLRDQAGHAYVYFNYGLGDNDFGSVHPQNVVDVVIAIDDGEWHGVGNLNSALVGCLKQAVNPDEPSNKRAADQDFMMVV